MSGAVLDVSDPSVNMTDRRPCPHGAYIHRRVLVEQTSKPSMPDGGKCCGVKIKQEKRIGNVDTI